MKKVNVLSMCLVLAVTAALFSSCANPSGKSDPDNTVPQPADSIKEETVAPAEPLDLSKLSEEELGKIEAGLLESFESAATSETLAVNIRLAKPMSDIEFESAVDAQLKINEQKTDEINAELLKLRNERADLVKNGTAAEEYSSNQKLTEISDKITALEADLLKYSTEYNNGVNQVVKSEYLPILESFLEEYDLKSKYSNNIIPSLMLIERVQINTAQLIEIVRDGDVLNVYTPEDPDDIIVDVEYYDYFTSNETDIIKSSAGTDPLSSDNQ